MDQLHRLLPLTGRRLTVDGQLRSFNNKSGSGSRLVISVFAQLLTPAGVPVSDPLLPLSPCAPLSLSSSPLLHLPEALRKLNSQQMTNQLEREETEFN